MPTLGQQIELSAEQQQILNSLPPAQRQQALDALREANATRSPTLPATTIRETEEDSFVQVEADTGSADLEGSRVQGGDSLVLTLTPQDELDDDHRELVENDRLLVELSGTNVFAVDSHGVLSLAGMASIPLLGLDESDVERRLRAEPLLDFFDIEVRLLDAQPSGRDALRPYGYDILRPADGDLTPPQSGPVPPDYVLGPGDTVRVQLFGNVNGVYEYEVSRDGILNLPEIGPVTVAGIPFSEFRRDLDGRVQEMLIGTQVSVTMGPLRTIRVFVLGDVARPGSFVVSGFSTMSGALYASGGISETGSLRSVQLKRKGRLVATLDLYELLLEGDNSDDRRLQPGDVVFVPPVGPTVGVAGAVRRPAVYETLDQSNVGEVVALAGGLRPDAFAKSARVERIGTDGERRVIGVDLTDADSLNSAVRAGDVLLIPEVLPDLGNAVVLSGHVQRPGPYQWSEGMRLTDLISSRAQLKTGVDDTYVLVRRERESGEPVQALSADLSVALERPSGPENIELRPRDTVHVFDMTYGRQRVVAPLLDELRRQSTFEMPFQKVEVAGYVRAPGEYPLEPGMRVSDLLRAGGTLSEEAYILKAELTRYSVASGSGREADVFEVNLAEALRGSISDDLLLLPHDHLSITRVPEWDTAWAVTLEGEVRFPGQYRIRRGETLRSVLQRAGGLTSSAFPEGAVFLRDSLKEREQEQVEILARRLEADLAARSLESIDTNGSEALATGQALLEQLRNYEPVGRLVLRSEHLLSSTSGDAMDVELRDGDALLVPPRTQVVTVIGEAQQNTSHLYHDGLSRDDYIQLSGGLTRRADKKLIYVVRANGEVVARGRSRWLGNGRAVDIRPGDTIVVPLATDRIRPLTFWTNVTQILYQGAIAVAAVRTFDN